MKQIPIMAVCTGCILFALMMTWGFNAGVEQTRRALAIDGWPWLDRVPFYEYARTKRVDDCAQIQIAFIIVAVIMFVVTIFLLAVGIASTGSTRESMFRREHPLLRTRGHELSSDAESRVGGRVACVIALVLCFALLAAWLVSRVIPGNARTR